MQRVWLNLFIASAVAVLVLATVDYNVDTTVLHWRIINNKQVDTMEYPEPAIDNVKTLDQNDFDEMKLEEEDSDEQQRIVYMR